MEKKMNFEPQCKTKADLYREWARILDMCEGTNINPESCVKNVIETFRPFSADFISHPSCFEFAIGIVEDKPVFRGDELWHKDGSKYIVEGIEQCTLGDAFVTLTQNFDGDYIRNYSWNPPKPKTFSIQNFPVPDVQWHTERCGGEISLHLEYKDSKQALEIESKILEVFSQLNI